MNNDFETMINTMTAARSRRTTPARTGFYTAASAIRRKKPISRRTRRLSSGATATRKNVIVSGQNGKSGKPPRNAAATLKRWRI